MSKRTISARRWLLLPMEIKVREFESKVLLACIAAAKGFGVLLGRNGFNTTGWYPQGVYLDKCISPNKLDIFKYQVDELGNKLASLDVEGVVYQSEEKWLKVRTSQQTVDKSSLILTWGDDQYRMINDVYQIPHKLQAVGSPSADLWHPRMHFLYEQQVDNILERFGELILIPSNFAMIINANGPDYYMDQFIKNKFAQSEAEIQFLREAIAYHQKVFDKFIEIIPAIGEDNPDKTVILRPHPGDDNSVWMNLSKTWPFNVKVVYEGNVSPWILASKVLVHNSCSTAVEAYAMGKPAIAYIPYTDARFEQNIPNPLSQQAETIPDLLQLIQANLHEDGLGRALQHAALYNRFIKNSDHEFAAERIVSALQNLDLPQTPFSFQRYGTLQKIRVLARKARRRYRDFKGKNEFSHTYRKQKNPGVSLVEVKELIRLYQDNLGGWQNISVEQVEEDAFCFYTKE